MLLLLEQRGRMTGPQLARALEVTVRTVARDMDALAGAGVPVRSVRGPEGGYELLEGYRSGLVSRAAWAEEQREGRARRVTVLLTEEGRRRAPEVGLPPWGEVHPLASLPGWSRVLVRTTDLEATARQVLALAGEARVMAPVSLRDRVAALAADALALHTDGAAGPSRSVRGG